MKEVRENFQATQRRIVQRLAQAQQTGASDIVEDELRGLYHGLFVILDGGSALADDGLIQITDQDGVAFDRFLHEICFEIWPAEDA